MTTMQSRLLGVALLLGAVAVVIQVTRAGDPSADRDSNAEALARKTEVEREIAQSKARFDSGPFVALRKQLSDHEAVRLIVIPESYANELDTRCVVFENSELRTSAITCAGPMFRPAAPTS